MKYECNEIYEMIVFMCDTGISPQPLGLISQVLILCCIISMILMNLFAKKGGFWEINCQNLVVMVSHESTALNGWLLAQGVLLNLTHICKWDLPQRMGRGKGHYEDNTHSMNGIMRMYFMVRIYCIDECSMNDGIYDASEWWCPWRSIQEGFQFNIIYIYCVCRRSGYGELFPQRPCQAIAQIFQSLSMVFCANPVWFLEVGIMVSMWLGHTHPDGRSLYTAQAGWGGGGGGGGGGGWQIANFCTVISRNSIVKNSTSLKDILQLIRLHFGFQSTGSHFLDLADIRLETGERPGDLYQRLMAFFEDNLLTTDSGVMHHGAFIATDEDLTPTMENTMVIIWLQLINPSLPRLVKTKYGSELRNKLLASLKPEISQALPSLLDEVRAIEDTHAMRTATLTQSGNRRQFAPRGSFQPSFASFVAFAGQLGDRVSTRIIWLNASSCQSQTDGTWLGLALLGTRMNVRMSVLIMVNLGIAHPAVTFPMLYWILHRFSGWM